VSAHLEQCPHSWSHPTGSPHVSQSCFHSWTTPSTSLPPGLCTCCSLCQGCYTLTFFHSQLGVAFPNPSKVTSRPPPPLLSIPLPGYISSERLSPSETVLFIHLPACLCLAHINSAPINTELLPSPLHSCSSWHRLELTETTASAGRCPFTPQVLADSLLHTRNHTHC
jgi:hypothetical protein